ncbi:hypothetical protein [uncultured Roseibium sp.]|uniref:hypothetical protein n=1 Tax=uncultured Roseibium sp. TaxID=1936171 RepID=UPI002614E650|nr:hypothetical protein [uncultured Roseibium sp.]
MEINYISELRPDLNSGITLETFSGVVLFHGRVLPEDPVGIYEFGLNPQTQKQKDTLAAKIATAQVNHAAAIAKYEAHVAGIASQRAEFEAAHAAWLVAFNAKRAEAKDEPSYAEPFPMAEPVYYEPYDRSNAATVRRAVGDWINDGNAIPEYFPPTPDELRGAMLPLTSRQFRLGLLHSGTTETDVAAIIAQISDPTERAVADIEWRTADSFERSHPLIETLSTKLGYTPEIIDSLWDYYLTI